MEINTKFKPRTRIVYFDYDNNHLSNSYYVVSKKTWLKFKGKFALEETIKKCKRSYGCKPILISSNRKITKGSLRYLKETRNYMPYNKTTKILYGVGIDYNKHKV